MLGDAGRMVVRMEGREVKQQPITASDFASTTGNKKKHKDSGFPRGKTRDFTRNVAIEAATTGDVAMSKPLGGFLIGCRPDHGGCVGIYFQNPA